ncbi:MAG: ferrous iron transporter B [Acidobacteriaceae bacterium]
MPAFRTVAIIGPPNVGKSTVFNRLTGLRQKVGNYSGVTVEQHEGQIKGTRTKLLDLPGVWSLEGDESDLTSEDQCIAVRALRGEIEGQPKPEAVLLVLDATQLHRQMTLARQVIAHHLPTLVVVNMTDVLAAREGYLDPLSLAQTLNSPVAMVSAGTGSGMDAIRRFVGVKTASAKSPLLPVMQPRVQQRQMGCPRSMSEIENQGLYRRPLPSEWSRRIDRVALHPVFGPALFFIVTLAVFQTIFRVAAPASNLFQKFLTALGVWFGAFIPPGVMHSLVIDGLWTGVVSVLTFLPQILLLFLVIALLEDSGYMARAAVIADRTMSRFGLSGRSFLPLLSAYACAVPAIMATRTIASRRDRLTTILVAPFMTCSARLPLYTMVIAAFIPDRPVVGQFLGLRACAMMGLYAIGMVAALITSWLLHLSLLRKDDSAFAIELPEFRLPLVHSLAINLLDRARIFVSRVGGIILVTSLVVWMLANFPVHHGQLSPIDQSYLGSIGNAMEPALRPLGLDRSVGVALLTAFAARETVVSTLGTLYHTPQVGLALRGSIGLAGALSLLVFFALAMQCTSTLATVKRETNSWRWPLFQLVYMSAVAYSMAWITFNLSLWFLQR